MREGNYPRFPSPFHSVERPWGASNSFLATGQRQAPPSHTLQTRTRDLTNESRGLQEPPRLSRGTPLSTEGERILTNGLSREKNILDSPGDRKTAFPYESNREKMRFPAFIRLSPQNQGAIHVPFYHMWSFMWHHFSLRSLQALIMCEY